MINSFNNYFKNICESLSTDKKKFVLGLSGGLDSMALLNLLHNFKINYNDFNLEIFPIIIDHGLRANSSYEADKVKIIANKLGFSTVIKKISGNRPNGNIQNWARKNRRNLLCESSFELNANLLLAHHMNDQAETIFMRIIKKSGIEGLAGIKHIIYWNGISIIRPLMFFKKDDIKKYVKENKISFFEDDSNHQFKFERVKTRYTLDKIKNKTWKSVISDLNSYSSLNQKLLQSVHYTFNEWAKNHIFFDRSGAAWMSYEDLKFIFNKSNLFSVNVIGKIIQTVGGKEYPPKKRKTLELINNILNEYFSKGNLGNVNVLLDKNNIIFLRELRNIKFELEIKKNKLYIFDGRFIIISKVSGCLKRKKNEDRSLLIHDNLLKKYKKIINSTIPSFQTLEGLYLKPHLSNSNMKVNYRTNTKHNTFYLHFINRLSTEF